MVKNIYWFFMPILFFYEFLWERRPFSIYVMCVIRIFYSNKFDLTNVMSQRFSYIFCTFMWVPRVYAQTSFYQENLAFCFQLCTVTHFVGFLPLPWFSCSLVFFPYSWIRVGGFFVLCMNKKEGGLYLIVLKNYDSLTCLNVFFAIFNFNNILWKYPKHTSK